MALDLFTAHQWGWTVGEAEPRTAVHEHTVQITGCAMDDSLPSTTGSYIN